MERERRQNSMDRAPLLGSRANSTIHEDAEGEQMFEPYTDSPAAGDEEDTPKVPHAHVNFALSESPRGNGS